MTGHEGHENEDSKNWQQCQSCYYEFRTEEEYLQHRNLYLIRCKICNKPGELFCNWGRRPTHQESLCKRAVGRCIEHGKCFMDPKEMFRHSLRYDHERCYYEDCPYSLPMAVYSPNHYGDMRSHIKMAHSQVLAAPTISSTMPGQGIPQMVPMMPMQGRPPLPPIGLPNLFGTGFPMQIMPPRSNFR